MSAQTFRLILLVILICSGCEAQLQVSSDQEANQPHQKTITPEPDPKQSIIESQAIQIEQLQQKLKSLEGKYADQNQEMSDGFDRLISTLEARMATKGSANLEPGTGPIWGDVLPDDEPLLLSEYDPDSDITKLRPTLEAREENTGGRVRYAGNVDLDAEARWLTIWANQLKENTRADYLDFWTQATNYTNYIEKVGLTETEARQFADQARAEAAKIVPQMLEKWATGKTAQHPKKSIASMCYRLRLTEEGLGLTKNHILDKLIYGDRLHRARLIDKWKTDLQKYYESKDLAHIRFVRNNWLTGTDLDITSKELQRLRAILKMAPIKQ